MAELIKQAKAALVALWNKMNEADFHRGYDQIAGMLLRGEAEPRDIALELNVFNPSALERGALAATKDYMRVARRG